jgi:hypothetical protein
MVFQLPVFQMLNVETRKMEKVTREQYAGAVIKFIDLARQRTSGGKVAAQVLLSAYNGDEFQLDLASMGNFDEKNFELAMLIIRGRYDTRHEPHEMIRNGSRVFGDLWNARFALNVGERGKVACPRCDGQGELLLNPEDEYDERTKPCPRCDGKRRICRCTFETN